MANILLEQTGFKAELGGTQGANALFMMRMIFMLLPAVAMLGMFWLISRFRLDETRCHEIRQELEDRRGLI